MPYSFIGNKRGYNTNNIKPNLDRLPIVLLFENR